MHETPPSPDPEATDSAETRVIGPARRIPLNLVYDYPVRWSKYKVLRDLIQNFFDSIPRAEWDCRFVHRLVGERLTLTSQGVDFSYDWLIPIGASTKRDGDGLFAGYFGEGFKIAVLCALRDHGWQIEVCSRDWRLAVVPDTLKVDGRDLQSLAYPKFNTSDYFSLKIICLQRTKTVSGTTAVKFCETGRFRQSFFVSLPGWDRCPAPG